MQEIIVISLGGSLIVPNQIDIDFLKQFKSIILKHMKQGKRFIIITGGGRTARNYQEAAKAVGKVSKDDLDWLGIHGTRLNAHLMRAIFKRYAHPNFVKDPTIKIDFKEKILVAAGWKPGFSTDFDAVLLAKQFNVKKIINLSNIEYVYTKDPRKYKRAKKIEKISWKDFRKIVGDKWNPGLNAPFDPIASKECEKSGITVYIADGKNLENLDRIITGRDFIGTTISR
jgi:uridylate kinase